MPKGKVPAEQKSDPWFPQILASSLQINNSLVYPALIDGHSW